MCQPVVSGFILNSMVDETNKAEHLSPGFGIVQSWPKDSQFPMVMWQILKKKKKKNERKKKKKNALFCTRSEKDI